MKFSDIPQKFEEYKNYALLGLVVTGACVIGYNARNLIQPKPDKMPVIVKKAEKEYTPVALEELVENPGKYEGKLVEIEATPSWAGMDKYLDAKDRALMHFSLNYKRRWVHGVFFKEKTVAERTLREMNAEIYDGDEEKVIIRGKYQKDPNSGGYLFFMRSVKVPNKHKGED